jgi:hypothetical protein
VLDGKEGCGGRGCGHSGVVVALTWWCGDCNVKVVFIIDSSWLSSWCVVGLWPCTIVLSCGLVILGFIE